MVLPELLPDWPMVLPELLPDWSMVLLELPDWLLSWAIADIEAVSIRAKASVKIFFMKGYVLCCFES